MDLNRLLCPFLLPGKINNQVCTAQSSALSFGAVAEMGSCAPKNENISEFSGFVSQCLNFLSKIF